MVAEMDTHQNVPERAVVRGVEVDEFVDDVVVMQVGRQMEQMLLEGHSLGCRTRSPLIFYGPDDGVALNLERAASAIERYASPANISSTIFASSDISPKAAHNPRRKGRLLR